MVQFVSCNHRAWHAGASSWRGRERCNDFSIGIELEGAEQAPFEPAQYVALISLIRHLQNTQPIRDIAAHSEVAPGRKTDPGAHFDWARLLAGLARS
jgi:AmpD protein